MPSSPRAWNSKPSSGRLPALGSKGYRWRRATGLVGLAFALAGIDAGCIRSIAVDGRPCPCTEGYECCGLTSTCQPAPLPSSCNAIAAGGTAGGTSQNLGGGSTSSVAGAGGNGSSSADTGGAIDSMADAGDNAAGAVDNIGGAGTAGATANAGQGGASDNTAHDVWQPLAPSPLSPRQDHTAVWAGNSQGEGKLMIWAGLHNGVPLENGALYDPRTNTWSIADGLNSPRGYAHYTGVWTGDRVLIWGGGGIGTDSWGAYDPKTDLWENLPGYPQDFTGPMPGGELAVWTGKYFMVFARGIGARYELATRQWTRMSFTNIPYAEDASAVWTGSLWIIWGGHTAQDTGAAYDPATDVWTPLPVLNAPVPTYHHLAAWTGSQMLIFGGGTDNAPALIDPAVYVYDPVARAWSHTNTGASGINAFFPFVSTSQSLLVWEGWENDHSPAPPGHALWWTDYTWRPIQTINQPSPRLYHSATWTGREMIVWGGQGMLGDLVDGVRYTP